MSGQLHTLQIEDRDLVTIATIAGEIDVSNAGQVREVLAELRPRALVVDLTALRYLDSAGIAMLDAVRRTGDLRLVLSSDSTIARTLEITGLMQLIDTYPSVEAACTALRA